MPDMDLTPLLVAHVYVNYRGSFPAGFDFGMDDAALSARFPRRVEGAISAIRFDLPAPREELRARAELGKDGRPCWSSTASHENRPT